MAKIAVIGIGPMGSILSAHLVKAGVDVILVDFLRRRLLSIQKQGLTVKDPRNQIIGGFTVYPEKFLFSAGDIPEKLDAIFIATKTYSLMQVASEIRELVSPSCKLVIYQNGLDNQDQIAQVFGTENVFRNINNYAGLMNSDTEAEVTFFNRPNYIGTMPNGNRAQAEELAEFLSAAGLETKFTENIKKSEWEKVILNASLAPISAATGLTMKDVMDYSPLRLMVESLFKEGIQVGMKAGVQFADDFFESAMSYLKKGGYHKPSMLLDVENRERTEIDFMNGKIVEYGEKLNVPVSYNRMITALIKGLEQKGIKAGKI
ncbi:MAG: ketopantoate reductase family protein [Candidatus Aminicenantaceae bacterium]